MEVIDYDIAAQILGKTDNTIKSMVFRDLLTPLPRSGKRRELDKEQVLLFVGKRKMSLDYLDKHEYAKWQEIKERIEAMSPVKPIPGIDTKELASVVVTQALDMLSELFTQKKRVSPEDKVTIIVLLVLSTAIVLGALRAITILKSIFTSEEIASALEVIKIGDIPDNIIDIGDMRTQKAIEDIKKLAM